MNKTKSLYSSEKTFYLVEKIIINISFIMIGFLSSRTKIMENFPLGVSFVSAATGGLSLFSAVIGSSLGYFSAKSSAVGIRYISTLVAICAIRWSFGNIKKIKKYHLYTPLINFVSIFTTGIAFKLVYGLTFHSFTECILESLISSAASYALRIGFNSFRAKNKLRYILPAFSFAIIVFSLTNMKIFSLRISNIVMISLVLLMSQIFKILGGSISGIIQGLFYMICFKDNHIEAMSSPFSGMITGLFSKFGKIYIIISYILSNLIIKFQFNSKILLHEILEEIFASIAFIMISKQFDVENYICKNTKSDSLKILTSQNISIIENSFVNTKRVFEDVSNKLDKNNKRDSKILLKCCLDNISNMCKNIIENINFELNDNISVKIEKIFKKLFKTEAKVNFMTNNLKKSILQIETCRFDQNNLSTLEEEVGFICKKSFMKPEIFQNDNSIVMKFCEKTKYRPQIRVKQHISKGETNCGDCFCSFFDGVGNFYVIISDGMGKGNSAALSSKLVISVIRNMLRSGIDVETAIFVTNFVLIEKSQDESLATIDILTINLFTGKSSFVKFGSASSFIKNKNNITKIISNAPPIGILPEANVNKTKFTLEENDVILMVSDGVTDTGEVWIKELISNELSDINIVDKIIKSSLKRRELSNDDDITAITIKLLG